MFRVSATAHNCALSELAVKHTLVIAQCRMTVSDLAGKHLVSIYDIPRRIIPRVPTVILFIVFVHLLLSVSII
jgi:hypothetical protein